MALSQAELETRMRALVAEFMEGQPLLAAPTGPTCGPPCGPVKQQRRVLQSRRGAVEFEEPEHFCKPCRRAFFPSLGGAGNGEVGFRRRF